MLTINPDTKKAKELVTKAMYYEGFNLYEVYGSYSARKARAWENCLKKCVAEDGSFFHICSHNSQTFSVAWFTSKGCRLVTAYNDYFIPMDNPIEIYTKG